MPANNPKTKHFGLKKFRSLLPRASRLHGLLFAFLILTGCNRSTDTTGKPMAVQGKGLQNDTLRIHYQIELAEKLVQFHADSSLILAKQALKRSRIIHYTRGMAHAFVAKGDIFRALGHLDSSANNYQKALAAPVWQQVDIADIKTRLGRVYQEAGKYGKALSCYQQILRQPSGKDSALQAIKYGAYYNFTNILFSLKRYKEALHYTLELIAEAKNTKDYPWLLANSYNNIATIYDQWGNDSLYDFYAQKSIRVCQENHFYGLLAVVYANTSENYSNRGQEYKDKALFYLNKVKELSKYLVYKKGELYPCTTGAVFLNLGRYREAIPPLKQALAVTQKRQQNGIAVQIMENLASAYTHVGNYKNATEQYQDYLKLKDSLQSLQIQKTVAAYEVKFRTEKKEKELLQQQIAVLRQQAVIKRKNIWIAGISFGALVIFLVLASLYRTYKHKQQAQKKNLEILRQEAMIGQLRAFIEGEDKERGRIGRELHDGISSMLTAINLNLSAFQQRHAEISAAKELDKVMKMLQTTGIEIRRTAHGLMPDPLREQSLPEALEDFVSGVNQTGTFTLNLSCNGSFERLKKGTAIIAYRMIQEIIHNTMKHAAASRATIMVSFESNRIEIIAEDDGKGFDLKQMKAGIGLSQITERIKAMEGYQSIETQEGKGTKITIAFNTKTANKLYDYEHEGINN